MTPLEYALAYAAKGLRVVPIPPGCKYPKGIKNWEQLATDDPARITKYWTNHPTHGIGIATGPLSGVFVVDIDPKDGGDDSFDALEARHGALPETVETLTGGGGRHLFYRWPEGADIRNEASGTLGVGIDIRGINGQVVSPPTIHPETGRAYMFEIEHDLLDGAVIADAPQWLIDLLTTPPAVAEPRKDKAPRPFGDMPGDIWAHTTSWADELTKLGAELHSQHRDNTGGYYEMWTRPGKTKHQGASASLYYGGTDVLKVFTPNWPGLTVGETYTLWGLHVTLEHQGDYAEAARIHGQQQRQLGDDIPQPTIDPETGEEETVEKPMVFTNGRYLNDITNELVSLMVKLNNPPRLFRHGEVVSQLTGDELSAVDRVRMLNVVEMTVRPVKTTKNDIVPSRIEPSALDITMLRLLQDLPVVQSIMRAPFLRSDGTVCADIGYDRTSGNYMTSTVDTNVPATPTPTDVAAAVAVVDDFVHDFPLNTNSDRAHIFALLLTPLIRHLVPLTPLFVLDGNGPGVGKNLLAESCMYVATGQWVQTDPLPLDSEEQRKQITALMSTGRSVALFDEAHIVSGTSLARLITSTTWGDRLLGYSKQVAYPNRITVVALGNNVDIQGDMPRRSILIRLESNVEHPYDRQDFRHNDLRHWVETNRAKLLGSLLMILVAWHQAGRPSSNVRLGSFDAWASIVGGALANAGVEGFLANAASMRDRGATDDGDMQEHLNELSRHFYGRAFTTRQVASLLEDNFLDTMPPRLGNDRARVQQSLGHVYRRYSGRWLGTCRIVPDGITSGSRRFIIEQSSAAPASDSPF